MLHNCPVPPGLEDIVQQALQDSEGKHMEEMLGRLAFKPPKAQRRAESERVSQSVRVGGLVTEGASE